VKIAASGNALSCRAPRIRMNPTPPTATLLVRSLLFRRREDDGIMARRSRSEGISVEFQPMSPDETQRMMQLLLNQQAQFAADLAKSQERFDAGMERLSAKTDRIAEGLIGLTGLVGGAIGDLAAALRETDARLTAHIESVDSHLDVVIQMFERHLREDHGRPPAS
jgi:hypothetical protein